MALVLLAVIFYVIAVLSGGLGLTDLGRGASPFLRCVFAASLALTFVLVIVAGFVVGRV